MEKYLENFKGCLQKEIPFCQDSCPFGYDIFDFLEKVKVGNFNAAYKAFRNGVGFPAIVSSLCQEGCKPSCPLDCSINIKKIEQSVVEYATRKTPTDYNLPLRNQRIAIVGGGLSGLGCLLKLATKKYQVDLFEKSSSLGGTASQNCPAEVVKEDIELQLVHEEYNLYLNKEILSIEELSEYDAIYIATGALGSTFGFEPNLSEEDLSHPKYLGENSIISFEWNGAGVFFGGQVLGLDEVESLAMGLSFGVYIDNFLRTGNLNYGDGKKKSKIEIDDGLLAKESKLTEEECINLSSEIEPCFTKEAAIEEANRCIQCQCNSCQLYCDLASYSKKWPLRIRDEIQATTLPGSSEVKATPAKRLMKTCTQCGLCLDTCPKDINLGGLILEGRKSMHKQEKLPWAFNEYFMKDMNFSNGDSLLIRTPEEFSSPKYLFFPGCQLTASEPTLVEKSYELILSKEPSTGIFLGCCGLPALWSGDEGSTEKTLDLIRSSWKGLDEPIFVLACPSCHKFFGEALPEIKVKYLYDFIDSEDFSNRLTPIVSKDQEGSYTANLKHSSQLNLINKTFTIFDPCVTRADSPIRETIRNILVGSNLAISPNSYHENYTGCCGYGGQSEIADKAFVEYVKKRRLDESNLPYICYCINCRDSFMNNGEGAIHILDLYFGNTPSSPSTTERRLNRLKLKKNLLRNYWGEDMEITENEYKDKVIISDEVKDMLSSLKILEEEILTVIQFCERTKRVIYDEEKLSFSGYKKVGNATYWVEYKKVDDQILLIDAFTHRIAIDLEEVWNGEKRINEEML